MSTAPLWHDGLRVVKTARTEREINAAAQEGFRPLVKPVRPSPEIRSKFRVVQNRDTGEIHVDGDYRVDLGEGWEVVVDWTAHYPYQWASPFAAYLVPPDLQPGERVLLEDLIEDVVGLAWNQGDAYRLESCPATWTGSDFVLDYDPEQDRSLIIG